MKKLTTREQQELTALIKEIQQKQIVYLDMDGTIADLYAQENWLERLQQEDENIYTQADVIITEQELLELYPPNRFEIRILTMLAGYSTKEYQENVKKQKQKWLNKYYPLIANNKNNQFVEYGDCKAQYAEPDTIILDDNETIRENWKKKIGQAPMPQWLAV